MSELHKVGVVPGDQVAAMAETLLEHGDDRSFEGLCRLLSFSGLSLSRTHEVRLLVFLNSLNEITNKDLCMYQCDCLWKIVYIQKPFLYRSW